MLAELILNIARLAQSDRASDFYGGSNHWKFQSEGCEFDPRGGLCVLSSTFLPKLHPVMTSDEDNCLEIS